MRRHVAQDAPGCHRTAQDPPPWGRLQSAWQGAVCRVHVYVAGNRLTCGGYEGMCHTHTSGAALCQSNRVCGQSLRPCSPWPRTCPCQLRRWVVLSPWSQSESQSQSQSQSRSQSQGQSYRERTQPWDASVKASSHARNQGQSYKERTREGCACSERKQSPW
eukprot:136545-Chlamydomonas_euryale.AAC.4